jgi:hypothetical protein
MECRKDQENQKWDPQSIVWMVEGPKGDTHRVDRGAASQSKRWIGYTGTCRFAGKRRIFLDRQALRDDKTGKGTGGVRIRCTVAERTNTPSARQEILQLVSASGSNQSRLAGTDSRRSGKSLRSVSASRAAANNLEGVSRKSMSDGFRIESVLFCTRMQTQLGTSTRICPG